MTPPPLSPSLPRPASNAPLPPSLAGWRYDLTEAEAVDLGSRAIWHATHRDAYSGGINNLYIVKQDGWQRIHSMDVMALHDKFEAESKAAAGAARP